MTEQSKEAQFELPQVHPQPRRAETCPVLLKLLKRGGETQCNLEGGLPSSPLRTNKMEVQGLRALLRVRVCLL